MFKSGFVTIIGEPNVGKSTFLNQVLKQKVAIVSNKPQTTRDLITGIYNDETSQIIFIDTPGIHHAKTKLGEYMSSSAINTIKTVDLVLFMINAFEDVKQENIEIFKELAKAKTPVFLIINKLDTIKDFSRLQENVDAYKAAYNFASVFGISAKTGENVDKLIRDIKERLEEGPQFYPEGSVTDRPETFLVRELIREKVLELTHDEIPHSIMVTIDDMKYNKAKTTMVIHATIIVERPTQKAIIIGKGGSMLKRIGTLARKDIEALLDFPIFLEIFCKVEEDWRNREHYLKNYGYKPEKQ
ncbi:MAG: GTPase Era [Tenericutes bacterium HGW-Tenericutes-1]|jgi:GTP-binding protein Era|nr:MAG: GTPase Era [Tenericutes bacterium HGW-Tenericutes-1]